MADTEDNIKALFHEVMEAEISTRKVASTGASPLRREVM